MDHRSHQFFQGGGEDKAEEWLHVLETPELPQSSGADTVLMEGGNKVPKQTAQLVIQLGPGADGVALPLQSASEGATLRESHNAI